jgi:ubiquitin-protein ligase
MTTENNSIIFPTKNQSYLMAERCVKRDLDKLKIGIINSPIIFADPIDADYLHLEAAILGPQSTPYENGIFLLDIKLPEQYPVSWKKPFLYELRILFFI